jgi:O-antigen ligase
MNTSALSYSPLSSAPRGVFVSDDTRRIRIFGDVTGSGICLFMLCLLLTASAVKSLRVPIGGLLVHPYLFLLVPLMLFIGPRRVMRFPRHALYALIGFNFVYILSIATGIVSLDEILKIGAAGVTIISTALLVRTKADFRAAVLALSFATTILSIYNIITGGEMFGFGSLADASKVIANKNAFSLYVLPSLFLALSLVIDRGTPKALRMILAICTLVMTVAIFSSANRSGWLGAVLIGLMMYARGRRIRSLVLVTVIALGAYYTVVHYTGAGEIERRVAQTEEGYSGDTVRLNVVTQSLAIGLENPLLGVSPSGLSRELARRLPNEGIVIHSSRDAKFVGSHNVVLQLIGGAGLIAFTFFLYLAWQLWKRPRFPVGANPVLIQRAYTSQSFLRMMMILWILRGMFTDEILYSPSFCIGLGLCIGVCIVDGCWRRESATAWVNAGIGPLTSGNL